MGKKRNAVETSQVDYSTGLEFTEDDSDDVERKPAAAAKKDGKGKKDDVDDIFELGEEEEKTTKIQRQSLVNAAKKAASGRYEHEGELKLGKNQAAAVKAKWTGNNRRGSMDALFRGVADRARTKWGQSKVYVGRQAKALVICIPMFGGHGPNAKEYPGCLPMEFVFAQTGFPLGLVIQLVAKHGVGKSGLLAEFGRWFYLADGGMSLKEAETKFNPDWYESFLGPEFFEMMPLYRCSSIEDWQRKLTFAVRETKIDLIGTKENPGPGRTVPVLFGVDSIMGKQAEETQDKILGKRGKDGKRGTTGEGHASRGHPLEAQVITRYMRTIPGEIDNWPFSLVLVNHLRIKTDDMGNIERNKAGGEQVNFQESFELELKKIGGHKKKIECAEFEGFPVEISCEKNSFGPTHRKIQTRVLWTEERSEDGKSWRQVTRWDWDWSTIHLLYNQMHGDRANPKLKKSLKDCDFHLECPGTSEIENSAWSKNLGMTKKDARPWTEVGAMIREDGALMDMLRDALFINRRPILDGDYKAQIKEMKKKLR